MKIKIIIFVLSLILLNGAFVSQTLAQYEDGTSIPGTAESKDTGMSRYDYIELSKFIYVDPNSDVFFGSVSYTPIVDKDKIKQIETWKSNDDPHYEAKGDSAVAARKNVTDKLYGMTIIRIQALKDMSDYLMANNLLPELSTRLTENSCDVTTTKGNIMSLAAQFPTAEADHALAMNTTYTYYNCYDITYQFVQEKKGNKLLATDVVFLAGMGNSVSSGVSQKTVDEYNIHFAKPVSKNGANYIFNTENTKELMNDATAKYSTGACYEIMPTGTSNNCTTTIESACNPNKKSNIYFVHGISCIDLNQIFADQSASSANIVTTGGGGLKDKTLFEAQVPFGKVKNGISLGDYVNAIYEYLVAAGLVLAGIMFAIGGFQYMIGRSKEGMNLLKQSAMGLVLLISIYTLLQVVNPNTTNLNAIEVQEISREASVASNITATDVDTPASWKALSGADDPFNFKLAAPTNLASLPKEKVWNTHYYTLFYAGSKSQEGVYKYPITTATKGSDGKYNVILWTNTTAWCGSSMEGSGIFIVGSDIIPINVGAVMCGSKNVDYGFVKPVDNTAAAKAAAKTETWKGSMDATIANATCVYKTPTSITGGTTPKCSWWFTHPLSLWQTFSQKTTKSIFGGAGRTGGTLIPLRSLAILSTRTSILEKYIKTHGKGANNLLVFIPDAVGKQLKAPNGDMITHDGYFWVADTGSLSKSEKSYRTDTDGTSRVQVGSTQQIDMFTGTLKQKILDGNLHDVYIINCNTEPGMTICNKFYAQQQNGYPGVKVK